MHRFILVAQPYSTYIGLLYEVKMVFESFESIHHFMVIHEFGDFGILVMFEWKWELRTSVLNSHNGAPGGIRTHNLQIRSLLLYPLNYRGITQAIYAYNLFIGIYLTVA